LILRVGAGATCPPSADQHYASPLHGCQSAEIGHTFPGLMARRVARFGRGCIANSQDSEDSAAHPTSITTSRFGPWTPRIKIFSMSAVRLGPVMSTISPRESFAAQVFEIGLQAAGRCPASWFNRATTMRPVAEEDNHQYSHPYWENNRPRPNDPDRTTPTERPRPKIACQAVLPGVLEFP